MQISCGPSGEKLDFMIIWLQKLISIKSLDHW